MSKPYFDEALNTISASRFEFLMARLFGRKRTGHDGRYTVKLSYWRGKLYLINFKEAENHE